jgi:hypothetical protein
MNGIEADLDELVGTPRRRRRSDDLLDDIIAKQQQARGTGGPMVEDMLQGVTVSWLSQVFGMDPKSVKQKLADCPPLHRRKAGYVYHLPTACRYLIPPAITAENYIKTMKPADLPTAFQQSFWDAALKRQKWEENAGQLWRTDRVREVLGSTFQTIKFTVQLWADTLERQTGLSDEQRALLTTLVDELQSEIYKALVAQATEKQTAPQRGELNEMLGEPPIVTDDFDGLV